MHLIIALSYLHCKVKADGIRSSNALRQTLPTTGYARSWSLRWVVKTPVGYQARASALFRMCPNVCPPQKGAALALLTRVICYEFPDGARAANEGEWAREVAEPCDIRPREQASRVVKRS